MRQVRETELTGGSYGKTGNDQTSLILGEEFWFRGYVLPRQELAQGRYAWLVHGLLWSLHHLWQKWTLPVLLPSAFFWAYVAQRTRSTWFTLVAHGVGNVVPLVLIVVGIAGWS
ncbi:MAG: CPBP family intramembrane metalloprotease [Anaerolineae bacterium]|nr:CPBP family intramembrane metalloprotease [Anaerolineae bacterium]